MLTPQTVFRQPEKDRFLVEWLPDGSAAVFDTGSEAVHSLNETAALVWECCAEPCVVASIIATVRRVTGLPDSEAVVENALAQLERAGLVEATRENLVSPSRRAALEMIVRGSSVAFLAPLVLTLTVGEQHAFAGQTGSPGPTTTTTGPPTTTSTTTTGPPTTTSTTTTGPPTTTSTTTTGPPTTTSTTTTGPPTTTSTTTTGPPTTTSTTTTGPPTTTLAPDAAGSPATAAAASMRTENGGGLWRGLQAGRRTS